MRRRDFICQFSACACLGGSSAMSDGHAGGFDFCTVIPPRDVALSRAAALAEWTGNQPQNGNEAGVYKAKRWNPDKRELRVAFLVDGDLSDGILSAARGWEPHMELWVV